jgi:hypothetical protein
MIRSIRHRWCAAAAVGAARGCGSIGSNVARKENMAKRTPLKREEGVSETLGTAFQYKVVDP